MAIIQDNKELLCKLQRRCMYKTVLDVAIFIQFRFNNKFILFLILLLFLLFFLKCLTLCKSKAYERFWPKFKTLVGLSRAKKKKINR